MGISPKKILRSTALGFRGDAAGLNGQLLSLWLSLIESDTAHPVMFRHHNVVWLCPIVSYSLSVALLPRLGLPKVAHPLAAF